MAIAPPIENIIRGLDTVLVSKDFLLGKIKKNRETHRQMFEEALEGWHEEVLKTLETMMMRAKADKKYNPKFKIPMPRDHTDDYDRVIAMVEASLDDKFELTSSDFSCYVRDDWHWKHDFMNDVSNYTKAG